MATSISSSSSSSGGGGGDQDAFPLHSECMALLTMKCGSPILAVRKKLHEEILVPFVPDEGFAVFQTKIERHFDKIGPSYAQEQRAIYLKPSTNATQANYLMLTKDNFEPALRMRWKVSRFMKAELRFEVFCYFVETGTRKDRRRMSMKLLQQQQQQQLQQPPTSTAAAALPAPLTGATDVIMGPGDGGHRAGSSMLLPDVVAPHLLAPAPDGTMGNPFLSLSAAQAISQAMQMYASSAQVDGAATGTKRPAEAATEPSPRVPKAPRLASSSGTGAAHVESCFVPIPFRINGIVVPLEVDINALRESLGLGLAPLAPAVATAVSSAVASPTPPSSTDPLIRRHHHSSSSSPSSTLL